ncbi:MAG: hypothetical protein IPK39_16930 [Sulfuritalea sp.]|nr:hypothetical protein [Sulfuritalea sp.]
MSEWWTYSLRDLLLFSSRTYTRLFELHNQEWWPLPLFALALGAVLFALAWRGGERAGRALLLVLAACWLWVAWAWHAQRYAPINWAAEYFAWAWGVQAVLLGLVAWQGRFDAAPAAALRRGFGLFLVGAAWVIYPLLAPLLGRGWTPAELFGMAPDPTALATLGVLLTIKQRQAGGLFPIPAAVPPDQREATLWAMDAPEFWIAPLASLPCGPAFVLAYLPGCGDKPGTQCPPRVA